MQELRVTNNEKSPSEKTIINIFSDMLHTLLTKGKIIQDILF